LRGCIDLAWESKNSWVVAIESTEASSSVATGCVVLDAVSSVRTRATGALGGLSGSGMQGQLQPQRRRLRRIALEPPASKASDIVAGEPEQRRRRAESRRVWGKEEERTGAGERMASEVFGGPDG